VGFPRRLRTRSRSLAFASSTSDEYKLQPSVCYSWQRQFLEQAAKALDPKSAVPDRKRNLESKVATLERRLRQKDM